MKLSIVFALLLLASAASLHAQPGFPAYHALTEFLPSSPGALKYGLYGYENPAMLAAMDRSDLLLAWSDGGGDWNSFQRWGIFAGGPGFGFGLLHQKDGGTAVTDYRLSLATGGRSGGVGIGYGWSSGNTTFFDRKHLFTFGSLSRPNEYLSVGLSGTIATSGPAKEGVVDVAVRPLGTELVTLFGDYAIRNTQSLKNGNWSAGAVVEPLPGIRIAARYFRSEQLSIGVQLSLGGLGLASTAFLDNDQNRTQTTYSIRSGAYDRNIFRTIFSSNNYLFLNLRGGLSYQRFRLFDNSNTLIGVIDAIDAAREDPTVKGIAINTSGMSIGREMLWEIREKLREFKTAGKHVIIYFDRLDMDEYHFASIADRIVMDPMGDLELRGYASGRTYLSGMLDKLGIGFDELRFFKYKSAYETYSREKFSPGEKEQRQRLIDEFYTLAKNEIVSSGRVTSSVFDEIVDDVTWLSPRDALDRKLVDTLARWEAVEKMADDLERGNASTVGSGSLARYQLPTDNSWSEPPQIAIIYAIGECAMDAGINARSLVGHIDQVASNDMIKGVVFRVESPGGDGLASDIVAEALRRCSKRKPVIITQGGVAASGGYWLSMYGDQILAAPNTVTGSIGVISAWIYDKGAAEKIGATTDHVQRGKHADLGFGPTLPIVGLSIPERPLTADERSKRERNIRMFYQQFIEKVAEGRKMTVEQVDSVAQGRVWSGNDGKRVGLIDQLGGIDLAISIVRQRAGLEPDEEVSYVEYPAPELFDFSILNPGLPRVDVATQALIDHFKFRLEHNGEAMPIMPDEEVVK